MESCSHAAGTQKHTQLLPAAGNKHLLPLLERARISKCRPGTDDVEAGTCCSVLCTWPAAPQPERTVITPSALDSSPFSLTPGRKSKSKEVK